MSTSVKNAFPKHYVTTLANVQMPRIIYGCAWKKDRTTDLVVAAILNGFRGIDVANQPKHYNEAGVGKALQKLETEHGIHRSQIFLQTKFTSVDGQDPNNIPYNPKLPVREQVRHSFEKSKENLGVDQIDSLILHSPMRVFSDTAAAWSELEQIQKEGGARQIGISNFYDEQDIRRLWLTAKVKPAVIQNRFYPETGYDVGIRDFCRENNVVYQSFWTLTGNPHVLRSPVVRAIAAREGKTPEHVVYRYCIDNCIVPLCGTTNQERMKSDIAVLDWEGLTKEDISRINEILAESACR